MPLQVNLTIEQDQLGPTVLEVFENLTDQQKRTLAHDVLANWLDDPADVERKIRENKVIQRLRTGKLYNQTIDQIRASTEFNTEMSEFRSSKEIMVENLTTALVEYQKEKIDELVRNSPKINEIMDQVGGEMHKHFNNWVHDAVVAWFCESTGNIINSVKETLTKVPDESRIVKEVLRKVNARM